jgi:hypothetical protein
MTPRPIILGEVMNPRYCTARGCRSEIGRYQKSIRAGYQSERMQVPDGCLCMREVT